MHLLKTRGGSACGARGESSADINFVGAVGKGEVIQVRFKLSRFEVDQVWRDGVLMFDSGRESAGLT